MLFFGKNKKNLGEFGESVAVKYLKKKKYKIIERNFQNQKGKKIGEIDIIAKTKDVKSGEKIVFVEVKTRIEKNNEFPLPEESIGRRKLNNLQKIARLYIETNNLWNISYGFDAITVLVSDDWKSAKVRHMKDIFL